MTETETKKEIKELMDVLESKMTERYGKGACRRGRRKSALYVKINSTCFAPLMIHKYSYGFDEDNNLVGQYRLTNMDYQTYFGKGKPKDFEPKLKEHISSLELSFLKDEAEEVFSWFVDNFPVVTVDCEHLFSGWAQNREIGTPPTYIWSARGWSAGDEKYRRKKKYKELMTERKAIREAATE